jgi:hypothetical protein
MTLVTYERGGALDWFERITGFEEENYARRSIGCKSMATPW